jgi:hypothetical protein
MTIPEKTNVNMAIKGYNKVNITRQTLYPVVVFRAALSSSLRERNCGECFIS